MIKLTDLLKEESFTAINKDTGKVSVFKSKDSRDAAVKAGTHEVPEDEKGTKDEPKGDKPNMFSKDAGYDTPDAKSDEPKSEPSKYDDPSYWEEDYLDNDYDDYDDYDGYDNYDDDYDEDSDQQLTSKRLDKIEKALSDEIGLEDKGFTTSRSMGGGDGEYEGALTIYADGADLDSPDFVELSIGSSENDGNFSISFTNSVGEPLYEPNWDSIVGNSDVNAEQSYKVGKTLMKMPEVQKFLKGEISKDEFEPIYNKLKSKLSKSSSNEGRISLTKLKEQRLRRLVREELQRLNEDNRPLSVIANEIRRDWKNVNYAAKPYLDAMSSLNSIKDNYYMDSGRSIVLYFLSNAGSWRGETAKRIKAELKKMLK